MKLESSISECGGIILLEFKEGNKKKPDYAIDLDIDEARMMMLLIRDSLIRAQVVREFADQRIKNEN